MGWLVLPDSRPGDQLAQNLYICAPTISQHRRTPRQATIAILEERRELAARRDALLAALPGIGFEVKAIPDGAFYVYCDVSSVTDDSFAFAERILEEAHVAITPGRDFGTAAPERHIRIAYSQPIPRLLEAVERIGRVVSPAG